MTMQCFARWQEDKPSGLCFRDQTILQFGDGWDLLANLILLNPGSAVPLSEAPQNAFLESLCLPFLSNAKGAPYYRFSVDRLMRDLLGFYSSRHSGGVLKIYHLFNLKNQNSADAMMQFKANRHHVAMLTASEEIRYAGRPVVVACGKNAFADETLTQALRQYIAFAEPKQLATLSKVGDHLFSLTAAHPDDQGLLESYHPSYTFKYGNRTAFSF
ncbi:hypothetical protein [Thiocystis minor]|uniref:hypothetical protein n=1 Tax=Thiocystis minor TaxID=61597 RepID=UPI00191222B4|nr:hypothetical protein [Thiocystis minor]